MVYTRDNMVFSSLRLHLPFMVAAAVVLLSALTALSAEIDLYTWNTTIQVAHNGALLTNQGGVSSPDVVPFMTLVDQDGDGIKQGYNSSWVWEHDVVGPTGDLRLGDLPVTTIDGADYVYLHLDVNEPQGNPERYLSLDALQVFVSSETPPDPSYPTQMGDLVWDLDSQEDSVVLLSGHSQQDNGMTVYLPTSLLNTYSITDNFYLYSQFGAYKVNEWDNWLAHDTGKGGPEVWLVDNRSEVPRFNPGGGAEPGPGPGPIPEPVAMPLLLAGGLLMAQRRRRS